MKDVQTVIRLHVVARNWSARLMSVGLSACLAVSPTEGESVG